MLVITNREFRHELVGKKDSPPDCFSQNVIDAEGEVRVAKAIPYKGSWKLNIFSEPDGADVSEYEGVKETKEVLNNGKPVVLFVHGFFQTLKSNLNKAANIETIYDVNAIVFSWPSFPRAALNALKLIAFYILLLFLNLCGEFFLNVSFLNQHKDIVWVYIPLILLTGTVLVFYMNYHATVKRAEYSANALLRTINGITRNIERLEKNTGEYGKVYQRSENHLTLLVHSLGNHVVKTMVKRCNPDVSVFKNIILHQADVHKYSQENTDFDKSDDWYTQLNQSKKLYITENFRDIVLRISCLAHTIKSWNYGRSIRLGQGKQGKKLIQDMAPISSVQDTHDIFWKFSALRTEKLRAFMRPIIRGEDNKRALISYTSEELDSIKDSAMSVRNKGLLTVGILLFLVFLKATLA